jgi:cytochrome c
MRISMRLLAGGAAVSALLCALLASAQPIALVRVAPQASAAGDALFRQRCAACHAIAGKGGKLGPDLTGVLGRKAGSTAFAYSPAMKASGQVWSKATLDRYLAAPGKVIPGTRMVVSVSNPEDRNAIIAYLAVTGR